MAKATKQALKAVSQQEVAALLGKRTSWVRDHPDLPRNQDGSYDAAEAVAWYIGRIQREMEAATLPVDDLERAARFTDVLIPALECEAAALCDWFDAIQTRHGAAGLAAIMEVFVDELRDIARLVGRPRGESEQQIRERHEIEIQREIEEAGRTLFDVSIRCDCCRKVRRGKKWLPLKTSPGTVERGTICPECLKEEDRR